MKISVLIPVYNCERYLPECLDSVLAQDFKDMEILVSDDGSTDGTVEIIRQYAARDARIRWWQNPRNLGQTLNHNACLKEARGEFIKFIHADDKLLQPSALSRMAGILEQDATVALVGTASCVIDEQSRVLALRNQFQQDGVWDGKALIVKCLEDNRNLIGEPTATMFRRSQAGRALDLRYREILDLELWFHLLEQGRFAYLAEPLFAYRVHPGQETATIRRTGGCDDEYLTLLNDYYRKPWLDEYITRKLLFTQITCLRKRSGAKAGPLTAEMMARLKPAWFAFYWLKRKVTRPVQKLFRQAGARLKIVGHRGARRDSMDG